MRETTAGIDVESFTSSMHEKGYALVPNALTSDECDDLISMYGESSLYRKTIEMQRYRFGKGEYKYFKYPLPDQIQNIRQEWYPLLAPIANQWMRALNINESFPEEHQQLINRCQDHKQAHPTPLILKYGPGGFNTLHQDLYGDVWFPIQLVLFLSEPTTDYTGGEFVLTKQTPRAQSQAIVLTPGKGDIVALTTSFKPEKGKRGYYRSAIKHGVSEVHSGERHTMGIIFHDALS